MIILGSYSGLQLNKNKTEGLWLGNLEHAHIGGIKWSLEVKSLGFWFGQDQIKCEQLNWESKLNQCLKLIETWKRRNVTMFGKIVVIKSILLPKFTYLFQSFSFPKHILKKINTICFTFLWDGKSETIKRSLLINQLENGVLIMIDIESFCNTLKIKWVNSLLSKTFANWRLISMSIFDSFGSNFLFFYLNIQTT